MKIQAPSFSDRYKAHVEAERQYVLKIQQEDTPVSRCEEDQPQIYKPSIEEAFRSIRKENRNLATES